MTIELKKEELNILLRFSLITDKQIIYSNGKILLTEERLFFCSLLEKLTGIFSKKGLSPIDTPNELGLEIEHIIDTISREVYSATNS